MRKNLFKWHSLAALIAMLPVLIVSVTGSILVFKVEIDSWLRPAHMQVAATPNTQRVSLDNLMRTVLANNPEYELGGWEIFDDKQRSDTSYLIKRGTDQWAKVYVDQYYDKVLSTPQSMTHYLTDWLLELHYTFLLHETGAIIGFVIALVMLFLGISGIVLYRRFWAKFFTLRFSAAKRIFFSDLHKMIGISSAPVLIVLAITGGYWNLTGVIHELIEHADDNHVYISGPRYSPAISFEALRLQARTEIDSFEGGYLAMPHEPGRNITFYGEVDSANPFNSEYASQVSFDNTSGKLLSKSDIRQASSLAVFVDSFRKLHFGYFAGLTTRILWAVLGLSPVWLAITGLYLYWQRRGYRRKTKRSPQQLSAI